MSSKHSDRPARPHRFKVPDRSEVADYLHRLATGEVSRATAAEWAAEFIIYDNPQIYPRVDDSAVWKALTLIMAADIRDAPDSYLYGEPDFKAWLNQLRAT